MEKYFSSGVVKRIIRYREMDKSEKKIMGNGQIWLVVLRVLIGWHFLYEGIVKLSNPNWSSVSYLMDSQGLFSGIFRAMAANSSILQVVDFLNIWGLMAIGLGLILGLLTRVSLVAGIMLLAIYYVSHPPFVGLSYALPMEGSYLVVNKILIELVAMVVLFYFPTGQYIGIDRLVCKKK